VRLRIDQDQAMLIQISVAVRAGGHHSVMVFYEQAGGEPASRTGPYKELNVLGTPTGRIVFMTAGEELPPAPRGFSWRPLAERAPAELRARAEEFRRMAETGTTMQVMTSLYQLADRYDAMANQRERKERGEA
jgi:hypothetical protein